MRSTRRNHPEGHISVQWLDTPVPPTRWEQLNQRWANLPGAIVVMVAVFAIIVPWTSVPVSNLSQVSVSLPNLTGSDDGETASPVPPPEAEATPIQEEAPRSRSLPGLTSIPDPTRGLTVATNEPGLVPILQARSVDAGVIADERNARASHLQAGRLASRE
jgi:hypothetical protein